MIAGEGKLKESLLQKSVEEGVAEQLRFLGFVDNMPQFLHSIDIFLLPSHWEGFGYVIAEAMYCEKPVVAFNVSSNPEIVSNNETGFLVEHGDVGSVCGKDGTADKRCRVTAWRWGRRPGKQPSNGFRYIIH